MHGPPEPKDAISHLVMDDAPDDIEGRARYLRSEDFDEEEQLRRWETSMNS